MTFKLDKANIKRAFSMSASCYDQAAELQSETGLTLLSGFFPTKGGLTLLDLGCGTGFLTQIILQQPAVDRIDALIALDLAEPMLKQMRSRLPKPAAVSYLCADAEKLPLADASIDCIISNLALQWCRNSKPLFEGLKRILKPGGQLIFSTFGPQTLHELKQAWAMVDAYRHVNEFYSAQDLYNVLDAAGFTAVQIVTDHKRRYYPSAFALMQELKTLGAHNGASDRPRALTGKTTLQRLATAYETFRTNTGLLPATFEIIRITANIP
jgi:malonyl-CoA O-methyltransferase